MKAKKCRKNCGRTFDDELLQSIFRTSKKTIQEYVQEIDRTNRYKSSRQDVELGVILDDRSRLIDLYEACLQQDAHIPAVIETLDMSADLRWKQRWCSSLKRTQFSGFPPQRISLKSLTLACVVNVLEAYLAP